MKRTLRKDWQTHGDFHHVQNEDKRKLKPRQTVRRVGDKEEARLLDGLHLYLGNKK
jgi:hypothetical protein